MILLDRPYVSALLLDTIREHRLAVVLTDDARAFGAAELPSCIDEGEAVARARAVPHPLVYATAEGAFAWVERHLADTPVPGLIARFKDKARFRAETASLFPGLGFRELSAAELDAFDPATFPCPFVVKPSVGFLSLGVLRVDSPGAWPLALADLRAELEGAAGLFSGAVLDGTRFLVESCVEGREFAVDAYFDGEGEPVVLSVFEHLFASAHDTADRLYVTSAALVRDHLDRFSGLLRGIGEVYAPRNFAVHLELRMDAAGGLWPIEVNPSRFGGWCTTADTTTHAFGVNPYVCYLRGERPDWGAALERAGDDVFGLACLGNTTGVPGERIAAFDLGALERRLHHVIEARPVDHRRYPLFGFLITRTPREAADELDWLLRSDLREFVTEA